MKKSMQWALLVLAAIGYFVYVTAEWLRAQEKERRDAYRDGYQQGCDERPPTQ